VANPAVIAGAALAAGGAVYVITRDPMAYQFGNPAYKPGPNHIPYMETPGGNLPRPSINNPGRTEIERAIYQEAEKKWNSYTAAKKKEVVDALARSNPAAAAALKSLDVSGVKSFSELHKRVAATAGASAGSAIGSVFGGPIGGAVGGAVGGTVGKVGAAVTKKVAATSVKTAVKTIKAPIKIVKNPVKSVKAVAKAPAKVIKKLKFW
jgi:hypothetical protein